MTPTDIEVLLHCHVSPSICLQIAIKEAYRSLEANGLIEQRDQKYYRTTDRGKAHIKVLCSTSWPVRVWVDQFGNVI